MPKKCAFGAKFNIARRSGRSTCQRRLSILRFNERRRLIFGRTRVDPAAKFAIADSVKEIDRKPDNKPDKETNPGFDWQTEHQNQAEEHAETRERRSHRATKWTRPTRILASQYNHTQANQNKGKQCADVRQ